MIFSYNIVSVDVNARCMEVVYTADNKPTVHISARLPYENETVDDVLYMYAPIAHWETLELTVKTPEQTQGQLEYVVPSVLSKEDSVYAKRDLLLQQTDWTQLVDVPLSAEQKQVWATYRQQLRDVPQQSGFPNTIVWPVVPNTSNTLPVTQA